MFSEGLKELDISNNPLGEKGLTHIMEMVRCNDSLTSLNVANCKLNVVGIDLFAEALRQNSKIRRFYIQDNDICEELYDLITAETDANALLVSIRTNPHSVAASSLASHVVVEFHVVLFRCHDFFTQVYLALARKLRFLSSGVLRMLHENASFTVVSSSVVCRKSFCTSVMMDIVFPQPLSPVKESLFLLEPPTRREILGEVRCVMSRKRCTR